MHCDTSRHPATLSLLLSLPRSSTSLGTSTCTGGYIYDEDDDDYEADDDDDKDNDDDDDGGGDKTFRFMPTHPLHAVPADKIPTKCRQVFSSSTNTYERTG